MSDAESPEQDVTDPEADSIPIRRGPYPEFTWTAVLVGWPIIAHLAARFMG